MLHLASHMYSYLTSEILYFVYKTFNCSNCDNIEIVSDLAISFTQSHDINIVHKVTVFLHYKGVVIKYWEGGATKREGGTKFYPYKKGGRGSFSHPEEGEQKVLG